MSDPGPALRFLAPGDPELRARCYRVLAHQLVMAARPSVVLIESSATDPGPPAITLRPSDLATPALAAYSLRDPRGEPWARGPPLPISGRWALDWALEPAEGAPATPATVGTWDIPDPRDLLGPGGELNVQTFWVSGRSDGRVWVGRRVRFRASNPVERDGRATAVAGVAATEWSRATGVLCRARPIRGTERDWVTGAAGSMPRRAWVAVPLPVAERTAETALAATVAPVVLPDGHTVILGASGAGKTTFLAGAAAEAIRQGGTVLALDLHGDLSPAIVGRLEPAERARVIAVDLEERPVVGIAALAGQGDREAAQFVAAVKRLSPDGSDVYWGFRLERIFDAFVRLVQESGGSLGDLYALLTDADRRDAARLATRIPELARFLDELGSIVRRNPDFLWAAAARLSKIVLVPELAELLAPSDGGVPVEPLLDGRRSLLVRLPFTAVGPEAASFAASLILARSYLGLAARRGPTGAHPPVVVVLDEVQGFSPRLVAELLTEGRKFGFRVVMASQYPERLAPELRHAAAGVCRAVVAFRVPPASAAEVGSWLGVGPSEGQRLLAELPVGVGVSRVPGSGELRTVATGRTGAAADEHVWRMEVRRTATEFSPEPAPDRRSPDEATERLLLAILAHEERGAPVGPDRLVDAALELPGPPIDPAVLADRLGSLERAGLAQGTPGGWRLTPAGERRLGLLVTTGASRESAEHRALLLRAFRLLARHGARLEILRQGRYDAALPDGIVRQIPEPRRAGSPRELAGALAAAQRSWAWRFFGGLDVQVEAEVSGALRPARVRHGLSKARARGAFALFVVGDAARAAKVRRTLRGAGVSVREAQVWTLSDRTAARSEAPRDGKAADRSGPT